MSRLINAVSAAGAFVLAVTPLAALPGVVHAQEAHISLKGLDLSDPRDQATLRAEIDRAAGKLCWSSPRTLTEVRSCHEAVREEAAEKLARVRVEPTRLAAQSAVPGPAH